MSKIYCSNCGQMIPGNSNFCRYCGAPQHGREAAVYQAEAPKINNAPAAFVLAQSQKNPTPRKAKAKGKKSDEHIVNKKLAKEAKLAFFLTYMIRTLVVPALLLVTLVIDPIISSILIAAYFVTLYIITTAIFDSFSYSVDERGFQKKFGIINKQHVTIPYRQIENVNINRSFSDMIFGLARVNIETAGSSSDAPRASIGGRASRAEGHLPGVTLEQARHIHDLLLDNMTRHNGG